MKRMDLTKRSEPDIMVVIFGINTCFQCLRCKQLCESLEIQHEYKNLSDPDSASMFRKLFPDEDQVPQVLWMGEHIGGYSELADKIDDYIINLNEVK